MTKPSDRAIAQAFWERRDAAWLQNFNSKYLAEGIERRAREIDAATKPRTGACENKRRPGGCQLHNLHCSYPKCDEEY